MKLITTAFLITVVALVVQADTGIPDLDESAFDSLVPGSDCPNVQYKCPECPTGSKCIYPDSGGCENAGIPVCQSTHCFGILCLTRRLKCPDECPFSCRYSGPACCPFLGQPVCEPKCQSLAPCSISPCPKDCPGDCYYPNADYCCPKSGEAVCKKHPDEQVSSSSVDSIDDSFTKDSSLDLSLVPRDENLENTGEHQSLGQYNGKHKVTVSGKDYHHHQHGKHEKDDASPSCTKTVTDIDIQLEFVTSTRATDDPIMCAQFFTPCPEECPENCIYPMNALIQIYDFLYGSSN